MIKVLITGAGSYIGTSFENYIKNFPDLQVDVLDMQSNNWMDHNFSQYDCIFHVAGIAHSDNGKISEESKKLYYKVNTDLTVRVAEICKKCGVKQFIFMSSSIVYGNAASIGKHKVITKETPVSPENVYSDSKVKAEEALLKIENDDFRVVILRPPMIYGKNCKGNYRILEKIATKLPIFPYIQNNRSMLYIENLTEFVRLIIINRERGVFWPQNAEYVNTSEMVKMIAKKNGRKLYLVKGFTWAIKILGCFTGLVDKAFGNLVYSEEISKYSQEYRLYSLEDSVKKS